LADGPEGIVAEEHRVDQLRGLAATAAIGGVQGEGELCDAVFEI
jgi:hypothetical protein